MSNFKDTNFDNSKLKRGSILYSAKLSPAEEEKYALFNAVNIDWKGYKIGDAELSYSGDVISYIQSSYSYVLDKITNISSGGEIWDDVSQGRPGDYIEQRYISCAKDVTPNAPTVNTPGGNDENWSLTMPEFSGNNVIWMSNRKVTYVSSGNEANPWTTQYSGNWSNPIPISGMNGNAGAAGQTIRTVLIYKRHNDNSQAPTITLTSNTIPTGWSESPGNNTGDSTKYLWMSQGKEIDGSFVKISGDNYWSDPVCLTGADGEDGKDGDDIEFIYHVYDTVPQFGKNDNNPSNWSTNQQTNYLGPAGYEWENNPTGVTITYKYEYCAYRRKTGNPKSWTTFSEPFPWSIYGENGVDGDGVEYIFNVTQTNNKSDVPTLPEFNDTTFQQSEVIGTWSDNPIALDDTNNLFQWVSVRKYRYPKSANEIAGYTLDTKKKYWFPYSEPEIWNWYVENGKRGDSLVMLYQRTTERVAPRNLPTISNNVTTVGSNGWVESPPDATNSLPYLWMTSNYYTAKIVGEGKNPVIEYTVTGAWTTPVCLTGERGEDGADGKSIEFMYKLSQRSIDWSLEESNNPHNWDPDETVTINGQKFVPKNTPDFPFVNRQTSYEGWTDNPQGINNINTYEYVSQREYNGTEWEKFSEPVVWSKWGEDGVDGDGVEYIYRRFTEPQNFSMSDPANYNNPHKWDKNDQDEYLGTDESGYDNNIQNKWTDNPTGIEENYPFEYVSIRKKVLKTNSTTDKEWGIYSIPKLWAKYGRDGQASAITIDNNNENIAVLIDDTNHIKTNEMITDTAEIFMYDNLTPSQFFLNAPEPFRYSNNSNDINTYTWNSSTNSYTVRFGFVNGQEISDGRDTYTFTGTIIKDGVSYSRSTVVTVFGIHETDIPKLYQLRTETNVVKTDPQSTNSYIPTRINFYVSYIEEGVNKFISTYDTNEFNNEGLQLIINDYTYTTTAINPPLTYQLNGNNVSFPITAKLVYNNTAINSRIFLDSETIQLVSDGAPGADGKSAEYIYYLTDTMEPNWSQLGDPTSWSLNQNYQTDDYPFIGSRGANILNNNWTDNPSGVDETNKYEFISVRIYNSSTKTWDKFSEPTLWSAFGKDGKDADGIEYIYYLNDSETFDGPNPQLWINDENYQNSEYINDGVNLSEYYGDYVNQYLTFKALGSGEITLTIPADVNTSYVTSVSYKKNNGSWTTRINSSSTITITVQVAEGDIVEWKGIAKQYSFKSSALIPNNWNFVNYTNDDEFLFSSHFKSTCEYEIYGNIMSLLYGDEFNNKYTFKDESNCVFMFMFGKWYDNSNNTDENNKLKDISNLILPATELVDGCYRYMFARNTNLNNIIKILPAKNSATRAYERMFTRCSSESGSSISTKILLENNNKGIIGGMFGGYSGNIELNIELWLNVISTSTNNGFDYFIQGVSNVTIIQHGSYDLSTITRSNNSIPDSCEIIKSNGTLVWTDNPSGVNELYRYEWVSVRKYKEVTEDDTELLSNFDHGQKAWHPYSQPTLWAKYGERGPQGDPGGSGLVIDFDNDSLQIAVNSNGLIKDNQEITTYIHLYSGQQDITSQISSVSIPGNNTYNPFNVAYTNDNKHGYILNHNSSSYWYTFKVENCDTSDDGINNNGEINPGTLSDNLQLPFTISYNKHNYTKRLNFIPIQYGRDGADAETFELMIPESSIAYNPNDGTFTPSSITAQIKHISGSTTDIISYNTLYTTYNTSNITWKISYTVPVIAEKDITIDPVDPGTGVKPLSIDSTKGGSTSPIGPSTPSESQHNFINTTTYSDTATMNVNNTEYVEWKLWMNNKYVDMETTYIVHNGIKGDNGSSGSDAFVLDWTNDQINLAVDADGYILPGQIKYTTLNLNSLNGVFGNNPSIYITWAASSSAEAPHKKFDKITNTTENSQIKSNVVNYDEDILISTYPKDIRFKHGYRNSNSVNDDHEKLAIIVGDEYKGSTRKAYIPQEGIEIAVTVYINSTYHTNSTSSWEFQDTKILRVCGQHNGQDGQDGQNAVTYEINPSANNVKISGTTYIPITLSYTLIKYDGENINEVSNWPTGLSTRWMNVSSGAPIEENKHEIYSGQYKDLQEINLELLSGSTVIDRETIPIVRDGQDGEQGSQGFTGPIVRMRGEYVHNSTTYYGNGEYNRSSSDAQYDGTSPLYKDIVTYTWANGKTKYYTPKVTRGTKLSSYINVTTNTYLCKGSYFISNVYPATSGGVTNSMWEDATQYEFVATRLLYADQALVNQLSTHDLIATKQNGYPVAGITSGSKVMKDKEGNDILSPLNPSNSNNPISSTITNSGSSDNPTLNSDGTDDSSVRIFAGEIKKENNYSLTYAPFNVRQDGTAYMSKANIVGDVNIGGQVNIGGNVNIAGTNVSVAGDIAVDTLTLGNNSFYYNQDIILPYFTTNEHKVIYGMYYGGNGKVISPDATSYLWVIKGSGLYIVPNHQGIFTENSYLYTLYSGYGDAPNTSPIQQQKFWIVTKTNLFVMPTNNVPGTWDINLPLTGSTNSDKVRVTEVKIIKDTSNVYIYVKLYIGDNVIVSHTENIDGTNYVYNKFVNLEVSMNINDQYKYIISDDYHSHGGAPSTPSPGIDELQFSNPYTPVQVGRVTRIQNTTMHGDTESLPNNVDNTYQLYFALDPNRKDERNSDEPLVGAKLYKYGNSWQEALSISTSNIILNNVRLTLTY